MKMDISLTEALTGLKKAVKTLDERTLVIQTVRGEYYANAKLVLNTQIHRRSDQIWRFEDGEGRGYAPVQKPLREREAHHSGVKIYFARIPPWSGLWIDNQWKMWSVFKTEASLSMNLSLSSTWFSPLPWSRALPRNLHPYCPLRKTPLSLFFHFWSISQELWSKKSFRDEPILPDEVDEVDLNDFDPEADRQQQHHRM